MNYQEGTLDVISVYVHCKMLYTGAPGGLMRRTSALVGTILLIAAVSFAQETSRPDALAIVFKDGHQKTVALSELSRIDFKNGSIVLTQNGRPESISIADIAHLEFTGNRVFFPGRNHFIGKWEVRTGPGGEKFFITLETDGQARKTDGSPHGTWALVNGEAHISWDDGWHDIIRKVGDKHEKVAFGPGKSFDDKPSNITDATNTTAQPI